MKASLIFAFFHVTSAATIYLQWKTRIKPAPLAARPRAAHFRSDLFSFTPNRFIYEGNSLKRFSGDINLNLLQVFQYFFSSVPIV